MAMSAGRDYLHLSGIKVRSYNKGPLANVENSILWTKTTTNLNSVQVQKDGNNSPDWGQKRPAQ